MTELTLDAGTLLFSDDDKLAATYLLVPFGERCRSNLGEFEVGTGAFSIPSDLTGMAVNLDHARENVVAGFSAATEQAEGIVTTVNFAKTDAGRAAYADAKDPKGKRRFISAEVKEVSVVDGKAVSGVLFGAGLVEKPAFPGAVLLAAATEEETVEVAGEELPATSETTASYSTTDSEGNEYTDTTTTTEQVEDLGEGKKKITRTTVTVTEVNEPEAPAEQESDVTAATVPPTLQAQATPPKPAAKPVGLAKNQLFAALAEAHRTNDRQLLASLVEEGENASVLYAALSDIKATGTGGLANAMVQPQWIGELWAGRRFQRRYIPLFNHGDLTGFSVDGFKWTTKPTVGPWTGNKTAVPSTAAETEPYSVDAKGLAGANDIDRRFRDFSVPEFWESYFNHMTDSYDEQADEGSLADVLAASTAVVRGTVPAGADAGMVSIIDGALAVLDYGLPTFAVVAKDVWRSILLTPKDKTLEYLSQSLNLEEGQLEGFKIVPARSGDLAAGKVLVGIGSAAEVYELPGAPIRVEGLDMVKGGIDPGLFGYYTTVIHEEGALALVSPPA